MPGDMEDDIAAEVAKMQKVPRFGWEKWGDDDDLTMKHQLEDFLKWDLMRMGFDGFSWVFNGFLMGF